MLRQWRAVGIRYPGNRVRIYSKRDVARWIADFFPRKATPVNDVPADELCRDYAELLYLGVLKRPGESQGIHFFSDWLRKHHRLADWRDLLREFRNSPEASNVRVWSKQKANPDPQEPVHAILSAGTHCITSYTLKKHGLKSFSGPFDWIFSNLGMINHCIADSFQTFLDKRHFIKIPDGHRVSNDTQFCDHQFYKTEYNVVNMFNHYDAMIEKNYLYYQRCSNRFMSSLTSGERNIVLCLIPEDLFVEQDYISLVETVNKFPKQELLVIRCIKSSWTDFGFNLVHQQGVHKLLDMHITGDTGPVEFTHSADEMNFIRLLDNYSLS